MTIELTTNELVLLCNALNEVLCGIHLSEFETRLASDSTRRE